MAKFKTVDELIAFLIEKQAQALIKKENAPGPIRACYEQGVESGLQKAIDAVRELADDKKGCPYCKGTGTVCCSNCLGTGRRKRADV